MWMIVSSLVKAERRSHYFLLSENQACSRSMHKRHWIKLGRKKLKNVITLQSLKTSVWITVYLLIWGCTNTNHTLMYMLSNWNRKWKFRLCLYFLNINILNIKPIQKPKIYVLINADLLLVFQNYRVAFFWKNPSVIYNIWERCGGKRGWGRRGGRWQGLSFASKTSNPRP